MINDGLVSGDETSTVLFVQPDFEIDETEKAIACVERIEEIVADDPGPGKIYVTGVHAVFATSNRMMDRDNKVMLPLVALLLIFLLWVSFRTLRGVWIPLAVVVVAVVWTYGFIGLVGMKTTIICASIPIVLVSMGIADGIHILHEYYHHLRRGSENLDAIHRTMKEMNSPVVMTSVTTAVGFLALASSKVGPIREYGYAVALGVMCAMIFSMTFIPAMLAILGKPRRLAAAHENKDGFWNDVSRALGRFSMRRPRTILATFILVLIVTGALSTLLRVRNNPVAYFDEESNIRVSDAFLNGHFGGTGEISIQVDGLEPGALKDPELLTAIDEFQQSIEELPVVGRTTSVVEFLKRMNVVLNDDDPVFNRVPGTREDIGPD
ncbi:MAG: efflux RND transporter permease subunit [Deltaproteobacteria bacterium]|nr:efflux RND transporter permease subunit [Deltaproteobacteria bacterium]